MTNEELVMKIKSSGSDPEPDDMLQLYQQNTGAIRSLYWPYRRYSDQQDAQGEEKYQDLKQESFLALYEAVRSYDVEKESSFMGWAAYYIKSALRKYSFKVYGIQMPESRQVAVRKYSAVFHRLHSELGRDPSDQELMKELEISDPTILESLKDHARLLESVSLDKPIILEEGETTLGELQPDPDINIEDQVIEKIDREERDKLLHDAIKDLPAKEELVIQGRYFEGSTSAKIGEELGVSHQRVGQIEKKALERIRESEKGERLSHYYKDDEIYTKALKDGYQAFKEYGCSRVERIAISRADADLAKKNMYNVQEDDII